MLKLYDYFENLINIQEKHYSPEYKLLFFASDVMEALGIRNDHKSDEAIGRAIKVCISNNISLKQNFQRVFRFNGEEIFVDWHISTLACYLIIINADPSNRRVANAQLYFALKKNSW